MIIEELIVKYKVVNLYLNSRRKRDAVRLLKSAYKYSDETLGFIAKKANVSRYFAEYWLNPHFRRKELRRNREIYKR